jgi:hypothetical protein
MKLWPETLDSVLDISPDAYEDPAACMQEADTADSAWRSARVQGDADV